MVSNIDQNWGSVVIYFGEFWLLKQDDDEQKFTSKLKTSTYASFITGTGSDGVDILLYTLERDVTPSTDIFDA